MLVIKSFWQPYKKGNRPFDFVSKLILYPGFPLWLILSILHDYAPIWKIVLFAMTIGVIAAVGKDVDELLEGRKQQRLEDRKTIEETIEFQAGLLGKSVRNVPFMLDEPKRAALEKLFRHAYYHGFRSEGDLFRLRLAAQGKLPPFHVLHIEIDVNAFYLGKTNFLTLDVKPKLPRL